MSVAIENLTVSYQRRPAVHHLDMVFGGGEIRAMIGPNGAGKTTFFNQITGVYKPTSGSIVFDGTEVVDMPPHAITALGIGRKD